MDVPIDISHVTIETERLLLRAWQETDVDDLFEYASEPGVGEMAGWLHHENKAVSQGILRSFIDEKAVFAVVLKSTNKVIGSLGLHPSWANSDEKYQNLKTKEIGYVLSKLYWGQGLMPEAVAAVIRFCFAHYAMDALTCGHFTSNPQSKRVIEKCGFTLVKRSAFFAKQLQKEFEDMKYILFSTQQRSL